MIIDEFLYALGFKTDTTGAKTFVTALGGVDQASQHTTKSMMHAVTAGTLLAHGLEKASELLGELGHSFLENAEHMENAKVTMEALYSTAEEGDHKFKWLWEFAQKNPVMGMDAATEIFMALKNNGIDPTTESMKAFGDAASAVPSVAKLIPQGIAELIEGRYQAGGVLAPLINLHGAGKNRVYEGSYVDKAGIKQNVTLDFNNAEQATNQFVQILKSRFGGSMEAHAKTWFGLTQRMKSDWMVFTQFIMSNGIFDALKNQLSTLLKQWEAFTRTDEFRRMMLSAAEIGAEVVAVLGGVADALEWIIELLGNLTGAGNSLITGGFFLLLLDGSIVKAIGAVVRGIKAIAEAESIMALLAQANPLMWIIDAVALLAIGIGVLIKKWNDFRNGILEDGWLKTFFTNAGKWLAEFGAGWVYYFDLIKIKMLQLADLVGGLDANSQKLLADLQKETAGGKDAMEKRAGDSFLADQNSRQKRADAIGTVARAHPEWTAEQDMGWIKENRPAMYRELFPSPSKLKKQPPFPVPTEANTPKEAAAEQKQLINSYHMEHVTIQANSPQEFANQMAQASAQAYGQHQTTTLNKSMGGRK